MTARHTIRCECKHGTHLLHQCVRDASKLCTTCGARFCERCVKEHHVYDASVVVPLDHSQFAVHLVTS